MDSAAHHGHDHEASDFGRAFAIGTVLNLAFVIVEVAGGILAHSMALLADAGHNFGDVLGLLGAWVAVILARRLPTARYTYGLRSGTILASLANASILLVSIGAILLESLRRLVFPAPVAAMDVVVIALVGIAVNGGTALLFLRGRQGDINVRSAFVHMAGDAAISAGVVVAAVAVAATGWNRIDPAAGILIAVAIGWTTWGLFRESLDMMVDAVPAGIRPEEVRAYLLALKGVASIHDLHIWPMSTTETALTCHLVMPGEPPGPEFLVEVAGELADRFGIGHPTLQVERRAEVACALAPDHLV